MDLLDDIIKTIQQSNWIDVASSVGINKNDIIKIQEKENAAQEFVYSLTKSFWNSVFECVNLQPSYTNEITDITYIGNVASSEFNDLKKEAAHEKFPQKPPIDIVGEISKRVSDWKRFGRILGLEESYLKLLQMEFPDIEQRNLEAIKKFSHPSEPNTSWGFWQQYLQQFDDGEIVIEEMETSFSQLLTELPDNLVHAFKDNGFSYIGHPFKFQIQNSKLSNEQDNSERRLAVRVGSYNDFQILDYQCLSTWVETQRQYIDMYNLFRNFKAINLVDTQDSSCHIFRTLANYIEQTDNNGFVVKGYNFIKHICKLQPGAFAKEISEDQYFCFFPDDGVLLYLTKCIDSKSHALYQSMKNIKIANILHEDLIINNIIQINIILHNDNETTEFCKHCIDNNLFVNERIFSDVEIFSNWYQTLKENSIKRSNFESLLPSLEKKLEVCENLRKGIITLEALENCAFPSFTGVEEEQMDELKKLVILSPTQYAVIHSNQKHILLRGSYGCGKSLVLIKMFEQVVTRMKGNEICYLICNDQQSQLVHFLKYHQSKYPDKFVIVCSSNDILTAAGTIPKLSLILRFTKNLWKDYVVHVFIDEFNASYFDPEEVLKIQDILQQFENSYVIIAAQSMEERHQETSRSKPPLKEGYQFAFLEEKTSFSCFTLDYTLRCSLEINQFVEASIKVLKSCRVFIDKLKTFVSKKAVIDDEQGFENSKQSKNKKGSIVKRFFYTESNETGHAVIVKPVTVYYFDNRNSDFLKDIYGIYISALQYILRDVSEDKKYVVCTYDRPLYNAIYYFFSNCSYKWTGIMREFLNTDHQYEVFLTDYASIRGFEFPNFIFMMPLGKQFLKFRTIECFTRCTSNLHVIVENTTLQVLNKQKTSSVSKMFRSNLKEWDKDNELISVWKNLKCVNFIELVYKKQILSFFSKDKEHYKIRKRKIFSQENISTSVSGKSNKYPWDASVYDTQGNICSSEEDEIAVALKCVLTSDNFELLSCFLHSNNLKIDEFKDIAQNNMLHYAAMQNALKISEALIDTYDISVDCSNIYRETPLVLASYSGSKDVVRLLIDRRAKVNIDWCSETPLNMAASSGHFEIVQILIANHANVNGRAENRTPLLTASQNGHLSIIEFLINNGADIHAKNISGETSLHLAASNGCLEVVEFLIKNGADIHAETSFRKTASDIAEKNDNQDIVNLLRTYDQS